MNIAIVDDDAALRDALRQELRAQLGDAAVITPFPDGEAFLSGWRKGAFDLIILDIFMGALTGVDLARRIRETDRAVRLVFCTTSNEFASESYEVDACYYLRKPFTSARIGAMLDRLNLAELERMRTVTLPDGSSVVLRDILYADFAAHRVTLHGRHGKDTVVRAPFSEIEPLLCANPYFFSPCKGVVINFYEVAEQTGDTFTMRDGCRIPISRRKAKEVLEAYSTFRFDRMRKDGDA